MTLHPRLFVLFFCPTIFKKKSLKGTLTLILILTLTLSDKQSWTNCHWTKNWYMFFNFLKIVEIVLSIYLKMDSQSFEAIIDLFYFIHHFYTIPKMLI